MEEKTVSSLSTIRQMAQDIIDRKEEYLKLEPIKLMGSLELKDIKKHTDSYKEAIERNNIIIDFLVDTKNTIFKMKLIKESIDKSTQIGMQQAKQIDYYISLLNDIVGIFNDERSKFDRIVRYNEKTYSYFNNINI